MKTEMTKKLKQQLILAMRINKQTEVRLFDTITAREQLADNRLSLAHTT